MKTHKLVLTAFLAAALVGCSPPPVEETAPEPTEEETKVEETEEERQEKIRKNATPIQWVDAVGDQVTQGMLVKTSGTVILIQENTFSIGTEENGGYGVYEVTPISMEGIEIDVTYDVYGTFEGRNDMGVPMIWAVLVE